MIVMSKTGFKAYHLYNFLRHIFFPGKKSYIIEDLDKLPRRNQFLKKWNDDIVNKKESLFWEKIEKLFNSYSMYRLFSYYYITDKSFYITDIIEDDFKLFRKYENELNNLKDVIELDFLKISLLSIKNNVPIDNIFKSNKKLPTIFKFYDKDIISFHSLIAFDIRYQLMGNINIDNLNIVEEEKLKKYNIIINKYSKIIGDLYNFDMVEFLRQIKENYYEKNIKKK